MTAFDAEAWIKANCRDARHLKPETLQVVSNFTLMWNYFENLTCGTRADMAKFERVAATVAARGDVPAAMALALEYWGNRYYGLHGFNALFDGLQFRAGDRRQHVEAVLSGNLNDVKDRVLGAIIIVYRLRNNLFHGLKEISTLDEQAANLDTACRVLAAIAAAVI
jgi:hypothetical protein